MSPDLPFEITVAVNALPTAPGGGLTNLLGLLEGFARVAPQFRFVVFSSHPETTDALRWRTCEVLAMPRMNHLHRIRWERRHMAGLLERERVDLVHCSNYVVPGLRWPQIVQYQDLHAVSGWREWGSARRAPKVSIQKLAARYSLRAAAANAFVSEYLRDEAERICPGSRERNHVIRYGLSEGFRERAARHAPLRPPSFTLAAIQSPLGHKDNESLLRALEVLVERHPERPWRLRVAGWRSWERWQKRAAALGVADRIDWLGYLDEERVAQLLLESDCLVFPSFFESFGLPVIEAMACGTPVVAVDATAVPEVAADAALLVPKRSPERLADAIFAVTTDPALRRRLIDAGRKRARDFSWQDTAARFATLFERVLLEHRMEQRAYASA